MNYTTVGDCCDILDNQRVPVTASDRKKGIYPYYGANGVQDYVDDFLFDDELVLVAEDGGHFGSKEHPIAYRVSGKCWVNNHAHVLKPREGIDIDYLCYSLMYYPVQSLIKGATRKKLNQADLRKMKIALRPLDEQNKIVALIKEAEGGSKLCREIVVKLDTLVKSRFIEMFGDPVTNSKGYPVYKLSDITTSRLGKMLDKKRQTGHYKYPYLANYNVQWFRFELNNLNEMDFDEADRQEFGLQTGDLLVCEGGEVGRCAIWREEKENCYFQKALHRVRCNTEYVIPEYLAYTFFWHSQYNGFIDAMSGVSTIAHLPGDKLKQLQIIVPPIDLQNQFAAFVEQVDKSKLVLHKLLEKQELLRAALMQEYFG